MNEKLRDAALVEPEQEPVAWLVTYGGLTHIAYTKPTQVVDTHYQPLYPAPPRREWVGLTAVPFLTNTKEFWNSHDK